MKDTDGDAMPDGALARLGSLRWRHGEPITFVAAPPGGKTLITAGQHAVLRLWDRDTGKELRRFAPPGDTATKGVVRTAYMQGLTRAAMSRDGKLLAVVLPNNLVQLWEVETGKALRQVKSTPMGVGAMAFTPDGKTLVVRGINDRTAFLYDSDSGKEIRKLKPLPPEGKRGNIFGGAGDGTAVAISDDGKTIALSELEFDGQKVSGSVTLFAVDTGKEIRRIESAANGIAAMAFSPDGKTLLFNTHNTIHVHNAETGNELRQIRANQGVLLMFFLADGQSIAVKNRNHVVQVLDVDNGKVVRTYGESPVPKGGNINFIVNPNGVIATDVVVAEGGKTLVMGGQHLPRFFDIDTAREQPLAGGGHRGAVTAIGATPEGKTILSRGTDGTLRTWNLAGKEIRQSIEPAGSSAVAFAPDGKLAAFGGNDGDVRLFDMADGKDKRLPKSHQGAVATITFSGDGKRLATRGAYDGIVRIFDIAKAAELRQITFHDIKAGDGRLIMRMSYGQRESHPLAFSADGKSVATFVGPQQVLIQNRYQVHPDTNCLRIFDVATGKELRQIPMPEGRTIHQIAFSRDGRLLISENGDRTVSQWEIASGQERGRFGEAVVIAPPATAMTFFANAGARGPAIAPVGVSSALSRDGTFFAAPGGGNAIKIYDAYTGKQAGALKGHEGGIASLEFTPDGKALVSGGNDSTLLVWDVTRLKREPRPPLALPRQDFDRFWGDLISGDAKKAGKAVQNLIDGADSTVALLKDRLHPAPDGDAKKIEQWIRDLDKSNFKDRAIAAMELEKLGELAVPALQKALASNPSLEMRRRLEPMLEKFTGTDLAPEQIRTVRVIEVLDRIASAESRKMLERLARGAAGSLTTRQAQAALERTLAANK